MQQIREESRAITYQSTDFAGGGRESEIENIIVEMIGLQLLALHIRRQVARHDRSPRSFTHTVNPESECRNLEEDVEVKN